MGLTAHSTALLHTTIIEPGIVYFTHGFWQMPAAAIIFNIIFVLAAWETVIKSRKIGFGNIRFLTSSRKTAYVLILVGAALCAGMTAVAWYAILGGTVDEFCRRCIRVSFSYASNPLYYLLTIAAILECAVMGVFVILLARNSLRYIREQRV